MEAQRRHVLVEEGRDGARIELIARGEIDESHLEAIEGFVKRQRARLATRLNEEDEPRHSPDAIHIDGR